MFLVLNKNYFRAKRRVMLFCSTPPDAGDIDPAADAGRAAPAHICSSYVLPGVLPVPIRDGCDAVDVSGFENLTVWAWGGGGRLKCGAPALTFQYARRQSATSVSCVLCVSLHVALSGIRCMGGGHVNNFSPAASHAGRMQLS